MEGSEGIRTGGVDSFFKDGLGMGGGSGGAGGRSTCTIRAYHRVVVNLGDDRRGATAVEEIVTDGAFSPRGANPGHR